MLTRLGEALQKARDKKGESLDAIASPAKISATYLHKLERGIVNNPSPRVLSRVAAALDVPYLQLMELAGYLDAGQVSRARSRRTTPEPHPLQDRELTPEEWRQVGAFIDDLVAKRSPKPKRVAKRGRAS